MPRSFRIIHAGRKTGGRDLIGLQIVQTDDGFEVIEPPRRKLASSKLINFADAPLLSFAFKHKQKDWTMEANSVSEFEMRGVWNDAPLQESDNWTATGTGTGEGENEDEARAASAS